MTEKIIKTKDREFLLEILSKDKIKNIDLINRLKNKRNILLDSYICNDAVLVKLNDQEHEPNCFFGVKNKKDLEVLIKFLTDGDNWFSCLEAWIVPYIQNKRKIDYLESCYSLYLPNFKLLKKADKEVMVSPIRPEFAKLVNDRWAFKDENSVSYIESRIEEGITAGIYDDNKLVAWCITHDDMSMGSMWVEPEYRRLEYAFAITNYMVKRLREIGEIPFIHIVEGNLKSLNLAKKIGFIEGERVCWVGFKK